MSSTAIVRVLVLKTRLGYAYAVHGLSSSILTLSIIHTRGLAALAVTRYTHQQLAIHHCHMFRKFWKLRPITTTSAHTYCNLTRLKRSALISLSSAPPLLANVSKSRHGMLAERNSPALSSRQQDKHHATNGSVNGGGIISSVCEGITLGGNCGEVLSRVEDCVFCDGLELEMRAARKVSVCARSTSSETSTSCGSSVLLG